jgi:hypothetical protein
MAGGEIGEMRGFLEQATYAIGEHISRCNRGKS